MTETKIPIENIYFLLCYAWKQLEEAERVNVSASDYTSYIDLFAKVLASCCAYLFKRGLDREYKPESESIKGIKGRLDFANSLNSIMHHKPELVCEYDELSQNILHNQIIKSVIGKVLRIKSLDRKIRSELVDIYSRMHFISEIKVDKTHFTKVTIHRNNLFYRFVLNVAYIINENLVLNEKSGNYEFVDFIRDEKKMAGIFENFIRNFYKMELKKYGYEVKPEIINWDVRDVDAHAFKYLPVMKTDISITSPTRKIIIDTKYYKECFQEHYEKKTLISGHFYQLIEYLENSDAQSSSNLKSEGILLYPAVNFHESISFPVLRGHKVTVRMINLNQDWKFIIRDLISYIN